MTFMHKLSARLARLRHLTVLAAFAAAACERPIQVSGPGGELYLVVVPPAVTVQPSDTVNLMALGYTAAGDTANIPVSWRMTGGTMVDSSTTGWRHYAKIKAGPSTGTFKVIADGNAATAAPDTAIVTVAQAPVASVLVSPALVSVLIGAGVQLTATPLDADGYPLSGRTVTWSSSNSAVAAVDGSGLVTGVVAGTATITATSEGQNGTAAVTVTAIPVATVSVSPSSASVQAGQTVRLTATAADGNGNPLPGRPMTWSSSSTTIATVSTSGLVTGKAAGSATITATSEGKVGSATVTVTAPPAPTPVATVTVTPATVAALVGGTAQLTATLKDSVGNQLTGRTVTWATSNTTVATVSTSGLVTGKAAGSATITATSEGKVGSSTVTVTAPPTPAPVATVTVTPATVTSPVGGTAQLTATLKDSVGNVLTGRTVTWASSNTTVATVSSSGLVTAKAAGGATITATSEGKSDTATITVQLAPVASVTVSPDAASVNVKGTFQFNAILKDAAGNQLSGRPVTWSSSNTGVATVSASGLASGVTTGTATISALSEGLTGRATLTVTTPPPVGQCGAWPSGIAAWVQPLAPSTGQAFYASPSGSDGNPGTLAAPWRSLSNAGSLQPGQILYLRAGTYGARGTIFTFGSTGTASAPITISGYPGDGRPVVLGAVRMTGQYIRLTGVLLDGPTGSVGGPGPNGEAILLIMSGDHTEFSNSEVRYDYWHAGIGGDGGLDYRVIGNYVHDNGGYNGDYNDPQNNTSHGMYASPSAYGLIANNIFEHNDAKGWMARHDANHLLVVNNTIVGNGRFGIDLAEQSHDIIAANNVVQNNGVMGKGGGGIQMAGTGPYYQINNVYWNNNGSSNVLGGTVTNALIANPLLVRASDGTVPNQTLGNPGTDYHLLAVSPAIGHADPKYALPFDITGKCRGSTPDAGAYQH